MNSSLSLTLHNDALLVDAQWQNLYKAAKHGWKAPYHGNYAFQLKAAIEHGITSSTVISAPSCRALGLANPVS